MSAHDCPQCGQDMRLPPDAYAILLDLLKAIRDAIPTMPPRWQRKHAQVIADANGDHP